MKNNFKPLLLVLLMSALASCGGEATITTSNIDDVSNSKATENGSEDSSVTLKEFENVTYQSETVTYDANRHVLKNVNGHPEGTKLTFDNEQGYIDVGEYEFHVTLSKEGYKSKTLTAKLTISPATLEGIECKDKVVTYDGKDHIDEVKPIGFIPENTTVKKEVKKDNVVVTEAIEVGVYTFSYQLINNNYKTISFQATLKIIKDSKKLPFVYASDKSIYFNNGLHNHYTYKISNDGTISLTSFSVAKKFKKEINLSYLTSSPLLNSIKEVNASNEESIIYSDGGIKDYVRASSTVTYYSKYTIGSKNNGIYKVNSQNKNDEPEVNKIFDGKADNLSLYNNSLYFINQSDEDYLYKYDLSSNQLSKVLETSINEFIIDNGTMYASIDTKTNDYIGSYKLSSSSSSITKLTNNAGENLQIYNGNLYYQYNDLYGTIDSNMKGVYQFNIGNKTQKQILKGENVSFYQIKSSDVLLYSDNADSHLYEITLSTGKKIDYLENFVAPESTPLNLGGKTVAKGNLVYYLNMYAGKTLWYYDSKNKQNVQLSDTKVMDFAIDGETLYFNSVTMLTNNDVYRVNLKMNEEPEKISSNDVRNFVFDDNYIYGTHYNFAGAAGGLSRMKKNGEEYTKFSDVNGGKNLRIYKNKLYYINCSTVQDNGDIEYIDLNSIKVDSFKIKETKLDKSIKNVKQFEWDNDNLYWIYNGTIDNSIRRTNINSLSKFTYLASEKTNPNEFIINGEEIYYYSYPATSLENAGFFKVNKNATGDKTYTMLHKYESKYYGSDFAIANNQLYFTNYIPKLKFGDAHFYKLDLNVKTIERIS